MQPAVVKRRTPADDQRRGVLNGISAPCGAPIRSGFSDTSEPLTKSVNATGRSLLMERLMAAIVLGAVIGAGSAEGTVSLNRDRVWFVAVSPIVSTETFDGFGPADAFDPMLNSITVDGVTWTDNSIGPAWMVGDGLVQPVSPPNALFTGQSGEDKVITFGPGRSVHTFGFEFIPTSHQPLYRFLVEETDHRTSSFDAPDTATGFYGFQSSIGIGSITVIQVAREGVSANYAFDDVMRSAIVPEPGSALLSGIASILLLARRRGSSG